MEPKTLCKDCQHLLIAYDEGLTANLWVCRKLGLVIQRDVKKCLTFEPKVPSVPYFYTPPPESVCKDCQHGLAVNDNLNGEGRWVCIKLRRVLAGHLVRCKSFVGPPPPNLDYPRQLDLEVLNELRLMVYQFGELLKALELQPKGGVK